MLPHLRPGSLVIVPGDREDIIGTIARHHLPGGGRAAAEGKAAGFVLTGGYTPRQAILEAVRRADLFAALVADDTYSVASEIHDLLVKTHVGDHEKIAMIKALVAENLDIDRILAAATEPVRV